MTNEHSSLEKYTSHTLFERVVKGLCVRGELETEQTATYWPPVPRTIAALLFSFCWAAQPGVLRAQAPCWELVLIASNCNSNFNCNWLQLTQLSMAPGYIIVWHPPASCECHICTEFNPSMVKAISWRLQPDAPVSPLTAGSKVNMLQLQHSGDRREYWEKSSSPEETCCHLVSCEIHQQMLAWKNLKE